MANSLREDKRALLKEYKKLEGKLSRTKETSSRYQPLKREAYETKRQFYNSKIDEILQDWHEYPYCPGKRWYRSIKGLVNTINELHKASEF